MAKAKAIKEEKEEVQHQRWLEENLEDLGIPTEEKPVVTFADVPKTQKITFINNRDPGSPLYFHYHSKTHPLHHYELHPGQSYELPLEVIDLLNGEARFEPWTCHSRRYARRMRHDGVSENYVVGYTQYFHAKAMRD